MISLSNSLGKVEIPNKKYFFHSPLRIVKTRKATSDVISSLPCCPKVWKTRNFLSRKSAASETINHKMIALLSHLWSIDRRQWLIVIKQGNIFSSDGCIFHFIFTNSSQHSERRKNQMFTRRTLNFALSSVPVSARLKVTTEISAGYPLFWALIVSIYIKS